MVDLFKIISGFVGVDAVLSGFMLYVIKRNKVLEKRLDETITRREFNQILGLKLESINVKLELMQNNFDDKLQLFQETLSKIVEVSAKSGNK